MIVSTTQHIHPTWIKYRRDYYKDWTCLTTIEPFIKKEYEEKWNQYAINKVKEYDIR
jgi:hypothetical protein